MHDEMYQAAPGTAAGRSRGAEVTDVRDMTAARRTGAPNPLRSIHLHSRPHIDLQRVAGALCCS
ncbi:putative leader peptide [Streptomyces sp. NPDC058335]|uniref:putative leader peptide n=1 Tax=Streptomyces sp. NPDC058335 TaxID=3346451 RepID=UPI0036498184